MLVFARASENFLEEPAIAAATDAWADETMRVEDDAQASTPAPRHAMDNARFIPGDIVAGRYRVASLLGRGGMGEVYRADDLKLGQPVALKFLAESLSTNGAALARFHREVSLARQISHRHVCRVYDIGEHAGMHFLSMEYVRGEELSSLLKRVGRLPLEKAAETTRQLCAGLAAIHAQGVVHRDLKPANVMIDEHGDVRITDFGVAALSVGISGQEAMIGTPAYMAPEQLAGGELTTRSDIYALGLVLYEAFTGNRPFTGKTLDEVIRTRLGDTEPTRPSAWIADLDPRLERVILRCLEKDPERRPATALQVAAALPGGDPLAAALAAGETPSPQMVAAATTRGGLRPLSATLLVLAISAGIAAVVALSGRTRLNRYVPLELSPEVLREKAAEIARESGYDAAPADTAAGFRIDSRVLRYIADRVRRSDSWEHFRTASLPIVHFWVRRSPRPLVPYDAWAVGAEDPPTALSGMVTMSLDTRGRLLYFEAVPPQEEAATAESRRADWTRLFERAGLTQSQFRASPPRWTPPQHNDERLSWIGAHPARPDVPLRIEAAAYRGKPVYFEVVGPWQKPTRQVATTESDPFFIVLLIFYFGAIALAALLAWKNLRTGRGDRRGAVRLMLFIFLSRLVYWLFLAHHVASLGEVMMFVEGLKSAVYWSALVGLLYVAIEPFLRRRRPAGLISWSRLLGGDVRDPLVGRDVLIGGAFGVAAIVALNLQLLVPPLFGRPSPPAVNSALVVQHGLDGVRGFFPLLMNQTAASILFPLIIISVVLFFAMILRRNGLAIGASWLALYAALNLNFGDGTALGYALGLLLPTILIVVLTRYGLLALVATFFFIHLWAFYPLTTELTAWYATTFLMQLAVLIAITLFAFRVSLAGQKVLSGALLDA